jgi:sodium/potassium-transporting ATPase subunit alpha
MGIGGSDVSKEAADMILMDDNFASIVNGVEEGRIIFDNLKKSIAYTLSSNIPEISPFILFVILGIPLPLGTILILCVDLGTDMVPAISLAYEGAESDIMLRPPRDGNKENMVSGKLIGFAYFQIGIMQALAAFYTYFVVMADYGFPIKILAGQSSGENGHFLPDSSSPVRNYFGKIIDHGQQKEILGNAQAAYFACIIVVQWADLIICKTRKLSLFQQGMNNWVLNFGLLFETIVACIVIYTPYVGTNFFGAQPIKFVHWLPGIPFAIMIVVYDEIRKMIIRFMPGGWVEDMTFW